MSAHESKTGETTNSTTRLFQDDDLNRRFLEDGYVVVPFLDAAAVAQLRRDFERLRPDELQPLHRSALSKDADYRREIGRASCRERV